MPDDLPGIGDPGFFTWPGCASLFGIFLAVVGIALGVFHTLQEYTEGLLLVIIFIEDNTPGSRPLFGWAFFFSLGVDLERATGAMWAGAPEKIQRQMPKVIFEAVLWTCCASACCASSPTRPGSHGVASGVVTQPTQSTASG